MARVRRRGLDLLAEAAHVDRDGPRVERRGVPPHAVHELRPGEDPARVAREEPEEVELARGQTHRLAAPRHLARGRLDHEVTELEALLGGALGPRPSQYGADAGGELARRE